jgi:release factor glutamine methyltransferase
MIVSNPPYVRELEQKEMSRNVLDYEPALALYVPDSDPLIFYRKIAYLAQQSLKQGGVLFFEINEYLGVETTNLLSQLGFRDCEIRKDIFGKDRMIKAIK